MQADRQTHRHTNTLIAILRTPVTGQSKKCRRQTMYCTLFVVGIFTMLPIWGAKYCDKRAFMSVCLSIRLHISKMTFSVHATYSSKTTPPNFTNFLYMLPMAVTRSSSDNNVVCCVLPVLWMTSCLPMGHIRIKIAHFRRS